MNSENLSRLDQLWSKVFSFYVVKCRQDDVLIRLGIHSYDHVYRVWNNVKLIIDVHKLSTHSDYEIVQAAAILHDIGYLNNFDIANALEEHVKKSMSMSDEFMQNLFSDDEIVSVKRIISSHHGTAFEEMNLEQKILIIADQIDLLGLDGTVREFMRDTSLHRNRDEIARKILDKTQKRAVRLFKFNICEELIRERLLESERFLLQVINCGPKIN